MVISAKVTMGSHKNILASLAKETGSSYVAEEHKGTSLGHACSEHYAHVPAKGREKEQDLGL